MKLTSIELHNASIADPLVLSFRDLNRDNPFNIKAITGLDADDIVSRFSGVISGDDRYYDFSLLDRILVMSIQLNPRPAMNESISSLRDRIYKMIYSSRTGRVDIKLKNGDVVVAELSGAITKVESPHFQKEQEVKITIDCDDPLLRDPTIVDVDVTGMDASDFTIVDNDSTAPHGFILAFQLNENFGNLVIAENRPDGWVFGLEPFGGFEADDQVFVRSELGNKNVYIIRGLDLIPIADSIAPDSVWPMIFPGENPFQITGSFGTDLTITSILYYKTYWGV